MRVTLLFPPPVSITTGNQRIEAEVLPAPVTLASMTTYQRLYTLCGMRTRFKTICSISLMPVYTRRLSYKLVQTSPEEHRHNVSHIQCQHTHPYTPLEQPKPDDRPHDRRTDQDRAHIHPNPSQPLDPPDPPRRIARGVGQVPCRRPYDPEDERPEENVTPDRIGHEDAGLRFPRALVCDQLFRQGRRYR
jgi:hypothetical protein